MLEQWSSTDLHLFVCHLNLGMHACVPRYKGRGGGWYVEQAEDTLMLLALTTCAHQGTIGHHSTFLYVIVKNVLMMSSKCLQLSVFRTYVQGGMAMAHYKGRRGRWTCSAKRRLCDVLAQAIYWGMTSFTTYEWSVICGLYAELISNSSEDCTVFSTSCWLMKVFIWHFPTVVLSSVCHLLFPLPSLQVSLLEWCLCQSDAACVECEALDFPVLQCHHLKRLVPEG